ncbi:hypothetical protein ABIC83_002636 [Roseateles asaccharophilus]|uniref:hypothetical protein n=1 Tax=Roseateles asaccharophilus TaxID=582607 RepID=UPI003838309E
MRIKSILAITLLATSGVAFAQAKAGEQRCQTLAKDVQDTYQKAVLARVPKTDPGSAVQESQDVKGILSTDAAGGLSKLMNLDFSGIMNKLIDKGVNAAMAKGTNTFNNKMNGILGDAGIKGVNFQGSMNNGVSGMTPSINTGAIGNAIGGAVAGKITPQSTSPYSRPGAGK